MIRYLTHNQIDKSLWDECVEQSPDGLVYVWSWYLDAVHPGWEALVEDDYKAVMPLTSGNKFGVKYLFQPFFTQKFGIFSKNKLSNEEIEAFLTAIPDKFKFAEFRINTSSSSDDLKDFQTSVHRNIELQLNQEYSVIAENYHSNTKRDLAKAKKEGLKAVAAVEPSVVIDLFRKNRGQDIKHWGDKEYNRLLGLVKTAQSHEKCLVLGVNANNNDKLVAGAFFMISHHKIVFLFSGTDEANKELHGLTFLLDYVIEKYSGTDFTLDFEGSDNDGLARFYKGFGGEEKYYRELKFNKLNKIYKFALKIFKNNKI